MLPHLANLRRFVGQVHRRMVLLRLLERAGLGLAIGTAAALLLVAVQLWRGQHALPAALSTMALAMLVGLALAFWRMPSRVAAAVEADRQLNLAELLSTAWVVQTHAPQDDSWSLAILTAADARSATLSPRHLRLSRFGSRAWGGIGLACALVLTLGAISANPLLLGADALAHQTAPVHLVGDDHSTPPIAIFAHPANRGGLSGTADRPLDDAGSDTFVNASPGASDPQPHQNASAASSGGTDGTGAGSAHTTSADPHDPLSPAASSNATSGGAPGTGTGAPSQTPTQHPHTLTGTSAGLTKPTPTTPWSAKAWPSHAAAAHEALRSGQIPRASRGLVKAYFEQP